MNNDVRIYYWKDVNNKYKLQIELPSKKGLLCEVREMLLNDIKKLEKKLNIKATKV